jgi:hypothetical protein
MKNLITIFLLLLCPASFAQVDLNEDELYKKDFKDSLSHFDYSSLWTKTPNDLTYGFIGDNYQRLRVKIITATKDSAKPGTYHVYGKSMVKNNICEFKGTITIEKIRVYKTMHWGVDDEFRKKGIKKQGLLIARYHFDEDSTQAHSGSFEGKLHSLWYLDKNGQIRYDDIEKISDHYRNNQFIGTWTSYKNSIKKVCNWGDYSAPVSGDLDIGAGMFSPGDKYLRYGWQSYRDAYFHNDKKAQAAENRSWWSK